MSTMPNPLQPGPYNASWAFLSIERVRNGQWSTRRDTNFAVFSDRQSLVSFLQIAKTLINQQM